MVTINFPKKNNLEWLRLIFAWQVVFVHAGEHLNHPIPELIRHFPGVPAFFFVSGFLIYSSYINSPGIIYYENRFLRLFPGLFAVTIGGIGVAIVAHGIEDLGNNASQYALWTMLQLSLGQAYNPQLFRDIGVGVINGSLWTITVEILFYLTIPFIVFLERIHKNAIFFLIILSFFVYAIGPIVLNIEIFRRKTIYDVVALTPIAWGWMFGGGIISAKYFEKIAPHLKYAPLLAAGLATMIYYGQGPFFGSAGNNIGIVYFAAYSAILLWIAFYLPFVHLPLDISYGTYVWHMPIINLLLVISSPTILNAILLTTIAALASWYLIEKPALKRKRISISQKIGK